MMGTCHCSRCRKLGASTLVFVERHSFRWLRGEELVARYQPEPPHQYVRAFCSRCGTALGEAGSSEVSFPIPANCLDDDPQVRNQFHVFVADKPAWYTIGDGAQQFEGQPGG
jgi:hypothetical protein